MANKAMSDSNNNRDTGNKEGKKPSTGTENINRRNETQKEPVEVDKVEAKFENGLLTIHLPKAEEVRPKTITIKAG